MNIYTNTKKSKKFILVLLLLILFNFSFPKNVKALIELEDIKAAPAMILFEIEKGVLKFLNNLFTEEKYTATEEVVNDEYDSISMTVYLTPENIIKGRFILFDANIFREISEDKIYYDKFDWLVGPDGREALRNTISGWYYSLRNFAIVALLSVLVYVGIRMIISTIAEDKAKYKTMFKDWLVALCLLVLLHYIMIGILEISTLIVEAIGGGQNADMISTLAEDISGILSDKGDKNHYVNEKGMGLADAYAKILVLLGIIGYTFIFAVKYLKREFTIIFLILLGPVSCITYPIDKISDGKAQAFNKWFSEILYQIIIQPFHLLLYLVLIGSATELANNNVIYALACFAVMIPAEKFVKQMFGFKDQLGSPLGAFAGGALASQLMNSVMKGGSRAGAKSEGGSSKNDNSSEMPAKVKETNLPGQEDSDSNTVRTNNNPQLNQPTDEGSDTVDTTDTPELNENEEESNNDTIDTTDTPELNENEERSNEQLDSKDNSQGDSNNKKPKRRFKGAQAVRADYNKKVLKKYGTLSKGELAKKRAWRATKGVGKFAGRTIKRAVTLGTAATGALALGTVGLMFGQGAKGAMAGAALGAKVGGALGKAGDKIASKTKTGYYIGKFYEAETDKDTDKEKYMSNQNNIDMAMRNFKERNGYKGSGKEIQQELENMYHLREHGVKDSQMEDTMNQYYDYMKPVKDGGKGMSDTVAMNTAIQSALVDQDYSRKDYNDPKKMQELHDGLLKQYEEAGITGDKAEEYVRNIMNGAGKMKGVTQIALPPVKEKIPIPNRNNFYGKWNFKEKEEDQDIQIERFSTLQAELIEEGYTREEVDALVEKCSGRTNVELVDSFETKVKYLTNSSLDPEIRVQVERREQKSGNTLNDVEIDKKVKMEKIERLDVIEKTGVKEEKIISKIRDNEEKKGTTEFREIGGKAIRGELSKNDRNNMSEKSNEMADMYKSVVKSETNKNPGKGRKKK